MNRIHKGFHRIGLTISVPFAIISTIIIVTVAIADNVRDWNQVLPFIAVFLGISIAFYALCRALAWIIEGFRGE
jgi:hypothetical protein